MRFIVLALVAVMLAGCATTQIDKSPGQVSRLKDGQMVTITGRIDSKIERGLLSTTATRNLSISIDSDTVIDAPINARNPAGEFAGKWKDKAVAALCSSERHGNWIDVRCVILIDNERTVTLSF